MRLYHTQLPSLPQALKPNEIFQQLSFKFAEGNDSAEMALFSPSPILTRDLFELWAPYRNAGMEYLNGHFGFFSLTIPWEHHDTLPVRMHIASRYITYDDLENFCGIEYSMDFDRLMDLTQRVLSEMIESSFISPGTRDIEIIGEPLSHDRKLRVGEIREMSENIGCSWLYLNNDSIFRRYSTWNSDSSSWDNNSSD